MSETIEQHVRAGEPPPDDAYLLLRGSPLELTKLGDQAEDFASRFTYTGVAVQGVSLVVARDEQDADVLMASRFLRSRPWVGVLRAASVRSAGFVLLPTWEAPHYTALLGMMPGATLETMLALVRADIRPNKHARRRGGSP